MNWNNVKLIFFREVRDQLRDRRTLFMIAVLPLLMYPLLGMSFFQISQFMREQPTRVLIVGLPKLDDLPPLVEDDRFSPKWLEDERQSRLFDLHMGSMDDAAETLDLTPEGAAAAAVEQGKYEAAVVFAPDFAVQLQRFRDQLRERRSRPGEAADADSQAAVPKPKVYYNAANEKSQLAQGRLWKVLSAWAEAIGKQNLKETNLPEEVARPIEFEREDVAEPRQRSAAMWSKIFPFVLLLWALTGAFYPAVDLCAGEKERGTLETLLSSPAQRSEIVTGKLLTVMSFSIATSVLNLMSMGLTGAIVISQLPATEGLSRLSLPPLGATVWLLVALVPVSALFSALCLALAAFARSTKEGQYYLMPLVLVTLPLVILPMGPGMELNLGNSLIPLTGLVLLLRSLLEGNYATAWPYVAPVVGITAVCCLMAVRWAVEQFNKESVLFRESERFDVGLWLRHLMRDRGDTPSVTEALFCGVLILLIKLVLSAAAQSPQDFVKSVLVMQLVAIATPALLMTVMLTRSPRQTLLVRWPAWWTVPGAALLALALHPALKLLQVAVEQMYPIAPDVKEFVKSIEFGPFWSALLLVAVLPAICEELAFRGFILSGMRHLGHKWWAILISSAMFGVTHAVLQQSLIASLVGAVIGYLAVQTGSIFPCMVFHFVNNGLLLVLGEIHEKPWYRALTAPLGDGDDFIYKWWVLALAIIVAGLLLAKFAGLSYRKTEEETLQEALEHQAAA